MFILLFLSCFIFKENSGVELKFETFEKGFYSGVKKRGEFVIKNREDFSELWRSLKSIFIPFPEPTFIDFEKFMLICVFMGERSTGGFNIEIERIIERGREILVYVKEESPGRNCVVTMAFTQPYHIVKLEKKDKKVKFFYKKTIRECD